MEKTVANGIHWNDENNLKGSQTKLQKRGSSGQDQDGGKEDYHGHSFPEGGWGWVVCLASFWTNGIIFGVMNCYGVIFVELKERFKLTHSEDTAFFTSWVGSISVGTTLLLSPVASILTDKLGIRRTAFLGGFLASLGMFLSSLINHLDLLYLTYGVVLGSGASLAYTPSLVILGHYFKQRLSLVNSLVTAGSSVFTTIIPLLLRYLLDAMGLMKTMQVLSAGMALLMVCALTFTPRLHLHGESHIPHFTSLESLRDQISRCHHFCHQMLDLSIWKNKAYVIWVSAIPVALLGYFVPYVHLVQHVKDILPDANGEVLVTCIGLTSGIGRLLFSKLADCPKVNRIHLQQVAFISMGLLTMLFVLANQFAVLIFLCLLLGLFDGCFISLLGPIAFDIAGFKGSPQAIGFLLGLCSIPLTLGPPIAGILYDHTKNYKAAFLLAGIPPIIGALLMCLINTISQQYPSQMAEQLVEAAAAETTTDDEGSYETMTPDSAGEIIVWERLNVAGVNSPKESTQVTLRYTGEQVHGELHKHDTWSRSEKNKPPQCISNKESSV
ncbi:monocarboxylate transporter 10-like [Limulus polyphemus]|uniref:Monocarboxylate transporter 10-like n=1 Tax=Limulus polyphemus TaxID=6850 RepID=A0ABM1BNT6_LIMPO|nr:monocarboxylate transporter 10-like [Limulus polyphemus]XP_022254044.1 monocarboxylate transporter 10-like [Limulus polyphemus]XP_022254045.1 monocarboxylate transporter 10-like [Limulus polyphemus]